MIHLNAKDREPKTCYLMTEKGILDYTVAPMQILTNMISSHVTVRRGTKQYKELRANIKENGLIHPIIVMPNKYGNYLEAVRQVKNTTKFNKYRELLAYNGNQRLEICRELGIDTIDCLLVEDVKWAHALQLVLQDGVIVNEVAS